MKMKKAVWFIIMLCIFASVNSQTAKKELLNAMNFAPKSGWSISLMHFDASIQLDSTTFYKGKHPMQIKQYYIAGFFPILRGVLHNSFFIPSTNSDSLTISLTCKSQNLKSTYSVMSGINEKEKVLYSDTLYINGYNDWHTFQKNIPLRDVAIVEIAIAFMGNDTLSVLKSKSEKLVSQQNLWLDRIEMKVDDKMITDYTILPSSNITLLPNNVIDSDSLMSPTFDTPFKDKKIVAFGESVHGSSTINEKVVQLLQHGIKYDDRKLILMELPSEKMFYVNRFIQGDSAFNLDSIKSHFEQTLYSDVVWIGFLEWLKKYNTQTNNKVWILGIDYNTEYLSALLDIFEYLATINRTDLNPDIAEFCRVLLTTQKTLEEKLSLFQSYGCFSNELGLLESKIIEHSIQLIIQASKQPIHDFALRDNVMFNNLNFLFNLFSQIGEPKIGIYSHFGHANYSSLETKAISNPPFGFLAKQAYSDDYFTVGIFVGGGKTLNNNKGKQLEYSHLQANSADTFEYWLNQIPGDDFYVPKIFLPSYLMRYRIIGNSATEFSSQMNPSCRMDGALFIKESIPFKKSILKIDSERFRFINRYKKFLDESRKEDFGKK